MWAGLVYLRKGSDGTLLCSLPCFFGCVQDVQIVDRINNLRDLTGIYLLLQTSLVK